MMSNSAAGLLVSREYKGMPLSLISFSMSTQGEKTRSHARSGHELTR